MKTINEQALESHSQQFPSGNYQITKKTLDKLFAIPFLLSSAPIIFISSIFIMIVSPGNPFYAQKRIGFRGKEFKVWKLRTMHKNADKLLEEHLTNNPEAKEEWHTYYKLKNDPRIIPYVGTFLRKTSLDELPQLWNVLAGDMSLVGPRPFPQYHLDAFSDDFQSKRQQVMPGLTGLWQISARSDGDTKVQEKLDSEYIEKNSILIDIKIILKTIQVVVTQKGAH